MSEEKKEKKPSLSELLHREWLEAGSRPLTKGDAKALIREWKGTHSAKAEAEASLAKAIAAESAVVARLIRGRGKGRLRIDGEVYVPMSRGETTYLRREGGGEVEDMGSS
jgi:hypothetical protein